jgi:hypothetical protein
VRLALVLVIGCAGSTPTPTKPAQRPAPGPVITPLEVVILDDYPTHASCDGVAAHRIEVTLDGRAMATVDLPCTTILRAPPASFHAPAFDVPPGTHVLHVRELGTGLAAERTIEFPVVEARVVATTLPVWANDDELDIQALRAFLKLM